MPGLIEPDLAAAGEWNRGRLSPTGGLDSGALNILGFQGRDHGSKVVAHYIKDCAEQVVSGMFLGELDIEGMNSDFSRRHGEDEPSFANIKRREAENVAKEGTVRLGILAVEQEMCANNHLAEYIRLWDCGLTYFTGALRIKNWM